MPALGKLEGVELSSVWQNEASFTSWLSENLDLLSATLGLPALELYRLEHVVGRYFADIICRVAETEEFVLVENQLDVSDHRHLGQILTYLSGLQGNGMAVKYVAWLAREFRDEHRAAVDWLNTHFGERAGFFAGRIEAWRIGSSPTAPRLQLVAQPTNSNEALPRTSRRSEPSGIERDRVAYWSAFSDELRRRNWPLEIREEAPRLGFYTFTLDSGRGIYLYAYRDVAHSKIGAYLSLSGAGTIAKVIFDRWSAEKDDITRAFGRPLNWWCKKENRNYRAQIDLENADPANEEDWPRQHGWLADQLEILYRLFQPRIQDLPFVEALRAEAPANADDSVTQ